MSLKINCDNLNEVDELLRDQSYICGYIPTQGDVIAHQFIKNPSEVKFPNLTRWHRHISSFNSEQFCNFPDQPVGYCIIGSKTEKIGETNKKSNTSSKKMTVPKEVRNYQLIHHLLVVLLLDFGASSVIKSI